MSELTFSSFAFSAAIFSVAAFSVGLLIGEGSAYKAFESKEICEYESKAECSQRWISVKVKSGDDK